MGTQGDTPKIGKWVRIDPLGPEIGKKGVESNPLIDTDPLITTPAPGDFLETLAAHISSSFVHFMARYDQNWEMLGCRSRHIGQLRANPLPECCRPRRVRTEDFNLTPIGGQNDNNCQDPL